MHLAHLISLLTAFWLTCYPIGGFYQDEELLGAAINALHNGLRYMENHVYEINLDGALGCKLAYDHLNAFLESRADIFEQLEDHLLYQLVTLRHKAISIVDDSKRYLAINEPQYYQKGKGLLEKSKVLMWFPKRYTKMSLQVHPLPCSNPIFNETVSDSCLQEIIQPNMNEKNSCNFKKECIDMMKKPRQRGYILTHQVLYFQVLEMFQYDCIKKTKEKTIPVLLRDTLCSNVMRDAEEIAVSGFPLNQRDLFMEQIGVCGLWGYKDFYNPVWLKEILHWQQESGCYANRASYHCTENLLKQHIREKRKEKDLEDGCLSHKTGVAMMAIAASVRFIIENLFDASF